MTVLGIVYTQSVALAGISWVNAYFRELGDIAVNDHRATTTLRLPVVMSSPVQCSECIARLREGIEVLPGVSFAEVDERTTMLTVVHDPTVINDSQLRTEAERLGAAVAEQIGHAAYRIMGLD